MTSPSDDRSRPGSLVAPPRGTLAPRPSRWNRWATIAVLGALGVYASTPWLAPVFMRLGWERPAQWVYLAYSTQCHQLANRSYFLFGPRLMYSVDELTAAGAGEGMAGLRAFQGSPDLGWKVAWSDRMVAMYSSTFVFLLGFRLAGRRLRGFLWWAPLLLLPLVVDGSTHFLSDLSGFGQGFRDDNAWLSRLVGSPLPTSFTAGDAWGSFNATARLVSGLLFGLGIAGLIAPHLPAGAGPAGPRPVDPRAGTTYNWTAIAGNDRADAT
jgi:uncharacterized membrane protein